MRKLFALAALVIAAVAFADSPIFRQRVRYMRGEYEVWLADDAGVTFHTTCSAPEQQMVDGGWWPLKNPTGFADGGLPTNVVNSCSRIIEARNLLDGGLQ
jgi:hypothetical protein